MNPHMQRLCIWSGPVVIVAMLVGMIALTGFLPPPQPSASAEVIAGLYRDHTLMIRLGCFLMCIGMTLLGPWGACIAMWTRRMESGFPVLTFTQLTAVGASVAVVVLIPTAWGLAAFRPDQVPAETTRMLNDFGWFLFLYTWPPFSLWFIAIGLAVIADKSETPVFPRWSAYLSFWTAIIFVPAGLISFFKTGPFAWNGLFAFYIPLTAFFVWMVGMTTVTLKAIKAEERRAQPHESVPVPVSS